MVFALGQHVKTKTGFTFGVVVDLGTNERGEWIDVKSDAGPTYRNCMASSWTDINDGTVKDRKIMALEKGSRVYVTVVDGDGCVEDFNGTVILTADRNDNYFISFDAGMRSRWVNRKELTIGEAPE